MKPFVRQNVRIILVVVIAFLLNKIVLRPYVIAHEIGGWLRIFTFSLPNFFESIVGSLVLTNLGVHASAWISISYKDIKPIQLYSLVIVIAASYVLLQEFKVHNLGGPNVFDKNDVLFSCLGLLMTYLYLIFKAPKHFLKI